MLADILLALQTSAPISALRASRWVYPLVNAGHILGVALLIGAIVPIDLRLLGFWRSLSIGTLARVLLPIAVTGLLLALFCGALLFSVSAVKYAGMALFQAKLVLIFCAIANALLLRRATAWVAHQSATLFGTSFRLQVAGMLSIGLWLATLVCGRLLAYS